MEDLLNEICQELKEIHKKLNSIETAITIYGVDNSILSNIHETVKEVKNKM